MTITTIDTHLLNRPGLAAAYLLEHDGRAAFVDSGTGWAVPRLLQALQEQGLESGQVDYLVPTHVHLDHAGGTGGLLQHLPNARVIVHPRGARHLIDPGKLIAGATAVYGEGPMHDNFGDVVPIAKERVVEAPDGFQFHLGGHRLLCLDTPGHARHHLCVFDPEDGALFTGDTFGLSYRALDRGDEPFLFPTTTPVQFDPEALHASVDRLMQLAPRTLYLTHFGPVRGQARLAQDMHRYIDRFVAIAKDRAVPEAGRQEGIKTGLWDYLRREIRAHGCTLDDSQLRQILEMDLELNAQGLDVWLELNDESGLR